MLNLETLNALFVPAFGYLVGCLLSLIVALLVLILLKKNE